MTDLKPFIATVPDFPQPGILFRDIMPLLKERFDLTIAALERLLSPDEWRHVNVIGGIESRGFILGAALAQHLGKGFVPLRKQGKLPPPVASRTYQLEYGTATLEMQPGNGRIVIVDDVIATGGTMVAAAELCLQSGFTVEALLCLVDLRLIPPLQWNCLTLRAAVVYD